MRLRVFAGHRHPALLEAVVRLRQLAWAWHGATLDTVLTVDALDRRALNLTCFVNARIVGASQLSVHRTVTTMRDGHQYAPFVSSDHLPLAVFNRLVVHPHYRRQRLAELMDERRLHFAQRAGARSIWVEARGKRVKALEALGFTVRGRSDDRRYPGSWSILALTSE